jgi:asparagine synthase (glutamine-hydrolysing)
MVASIAAILSRDPRHRAGPLLDSALGRLDHWAATARQRQIDGPAGLGLLCRPDPGRGALGQGLAVRQTPDGALTVVADARLDNADTLASLLSESSPHHGTAELLLAAYLRWGEACADRLRGDFAFVIYDGRSQTMYAARDAFGCKPLYYVDKPGLFALASEPKGLLVLPEVSRMHDEDWIADTLVAVEYETERTFFHDVRRLSGGSWVRIGRNGSHVEPYWVPPASARVRDVDEAGAIDTLREYFLEAVRRRLVSTRGVGCELSGGLDSSSIARAAALHLETENRQLVTFSHIDPENWPEGVPQLPSERPWAERALEGVQNIDPVFAAGEDRGFLSALDAVIQAMDYPPSDTLSTFSDAFSVAQHEHDIEVMLTGFGGDQVVTTPGSSLAHELARKGRWLRLWQELDTDEPSGRGRLSRYLRTIAKVTLPKPLVARLRGRKNDGWDQFARMWEVETPVGDVVCEDFYQSARVQERIKQYIDMLDHWPSVREKQIEAVHRSAHISNRMESYAALGRPLGIDYRAPFLDRDLVDYHLSLPATLKRRGNVGRYAFRLAMRDILPQELAWRMDKCAIPVPAMYARYSRDRSAMLNVVESIGESEALWNYVPRQPLLNKLRADAPLADGFWVVGMLLAYQWKRTYL